MMRKPSICCLISEAAQDERRFLAYAAPDLLRSVALHCPEALTWIEANTPEAACAIFEALVVAEQLESQPLIAFGAAGVA
jgi:hypothetical protein